MAEFKGTVENGGIRGEFSIWPGIAGGALVLALGIGFINHIAGDDSDPNTYDPTKLHWTEFTPDGDIRCKGLSPEGSSEVIASTIVCEPVIS